MTTPAETIARAILLPFAGVYYVATPTQQERVVREAAKAIEPQLAELAQAAARELAANPS